MSFLEHSLTSQKVAFFVQEANESLHFELLFIFFWINYPFVFDDELCTQSKKAIQILYMMTSQL